MRFTLIIFLFGLYLSCAGQVVHFPDSWHSVRSLHFDTRGEEVAIAGPDGKISFFDVESGKITREIDQLGEGLGDALIYHQNGEEIVYDVGGGRLRIIKTRDHSKVNEVFLPDEYINALALSQSGELLAAGGDSLVYLLPWGKQNVTSRFECNYGAVIDLEFIRKDKQLVLVYGSGDVEAWDLKKSKKKYHIKVEGGLRDVEINANSDQLAFVTRVGSAGVLKLKKGSSPRLFNEVKRAQSVTFLKDGTLGVGTQDGHLLHLNVGSGEVESTEKYLCYHVCDIGSFDNGSKIVMGDVESFTYLGEGKINDKPLMCKSPMPNPTAEPEEEEWDWTLKQMDSLFIYTRGDFHQKTGRKISVEIYKDHAFAVISENDEMVKHERIELSADEWKSLISSGLEALKVESEIISDDQALHGIMFKTGLGSEQSVVVPQDLKSGPVQDFYEVLDIKFDIKAMLSD